MLNNLMDSSVVYMYADTSVENYQVVPSVDETLWTLISDVNPDLDMSTGACSFPEDIPFPKDEELAAALTAAISTGSMTPIVKAELKLAIQSRRMKEGKEEMKVEIEEPKQFELTEEEHKKVINRRTQNRLAARRFRDRQKCKGNHFQRICDKIDASNTLLRYQIDQLRKEKEELKQALIEHLNVCPFPPRYQPYP